MSVVAKEQRIEFRIPTDAKKTIEEAANLANLSVSSYIISVVLKQARLDLKENEIIVLNNIDRDNLIKALNDNGDPSEGLKELFK